MRSGFVYALRSDNCPFVKIGRSNTLPYRRLKELNGSLNYGPLGPWEIVSYVEVFDAVVVETFLHRTIRDRNKADFDTCNELFDISPFDALSLFNNIPAAEVRGFDKVARLHSTGDLEDYLGDIFTSTGLNHMMSLQGIWALTMFPSTGRGRYFTLNIDRHEVAYSTLPGRGVAAEHMLLMDPLVFEYAEPKRWLTANGGGGLERSYSSGLVRQSPVVFSGTLADARFFVSLPGVRRALVAYWYDLLLQAAEAGRESLFARHHNLAAVESVLRRLSKP